MKTGFNALPDRLPPVKNLKFSGIDGSQFKIRSSKKEILLLTEKSHKKAPDLKVSGFF